MAVIQSPYQFDQADHRTRKINQSLVSAVVARIVEKIQPVKVILFGSRASGSPRADSDLDLLVVLADSHPFALENSRDRTGKVLDLFRYRYFSMDVIVVTEQEVNTIQRENEGEWNLILEIIASGKVLYEQP